MDHTVKDNHFYESITEVYADGSKIKSNYGPVGSEQNVLYDKQKVFSLKGLYVDRTDYSELLSTKVDPNNSIVLKSIEKFKSNETTSYSGSSFTYSLLDLDEKIMKFQEKIIKPSIDFYVFGYSNGSISHPGNNNVIADLSDRDVSGYSTSIELGAQRFFDDFYNSEWFSVNVPESLESFPYSCGTGESSWTRYSQSKLLLSSKTEEFEGLQTKEEYTYESLHNLLKTTTLYGSKYKIGSVDYENKIIKEITYGFESLFNNKGVDLTFASNKINLITAETTYSNSISNNNVISATARTFERFDNDGMWLSPMNSYVFVGNLTAGTTNGGVLSSFSPFDFQNIQQTSSNWKKRTEIVEINDYRFVKKSIDENLTKFNVYGYNGGNVKAEFYWPLNVKSEATYTGFEDHYSGVAEQWIGQNMGHYNGITSDMSHTGQKSYKIESIDNHIQNISSIKTPYHEIQVPQDMESPMNYSIRFWMNIPNYSQFPNSGSLRLKYELYVDGTVVDQGSYSLNYAPSNNWSRVDYSITINSHSTTASHGTLRVYLESDLENSFDFKTYVDDLLIYPEGSAYRFFSFDEFGNKTHITDWNNSTIKTDYDDWGRPIELYNSDGETVTSLKYFKNSYLSHGEHYNSKISHITSSLSNEVREFKDGFGKTIQQQISNTEHDYRRLSSTKNFDNKGRANKEYLPTITSGSNFAFVPTRTLSPWFNTIYPGAVGYSEVEYENSPDNFIKSVTLPYESGETPRVEHYSRTVNSSNIQIGDRLYYPSELIIKTRVDGNGSSFSEYYNKFGKLVLDKRPQGFSYSFDSNGDLIEDPNSTFKYSKTSYLYDRANNLAKTIDNGGNEVLLEFNSEGKVTREFRGDRGEIIYKFDDFGRQRFVKRQNDIDAINSGIVNEQFLFYKYDLYGRVVKEGILKNQNVFSNSSKLNDLNYPSGISGIDVYKEYSFDVENQNSLGRVASVKVYAGHDLGNITVDEKTIHYTKSGLVSKVNYDFGDLSPTYDIEYDYFISGLKSEERYKRNGDLLYRESFTYDELGNLKTSSSGESFNFSLGLENHYDAYGQVKHVWYGSKNDPLDPFMDYQLINYNLRGELVFSGSKEFKYLLEYDQNGRVKSQIWRNSFIDGQAPGFAMNGYKYYYDSQNRLVGANYSQYPLDEDPFNHFEDFAKIDRSVRYLLSSQRHRWWWSRIRSKL